MCVTCLDADVFAAVWFPFQIYIGAPNIIEFSPGPHSFIHAKDFSSPKDMASYVSAFLEDSARYHQMFEWKQLGLAPLVKMHLDNCVHYTECKVCELAHRRRRQQAEAR